MSDIRDWSVLEVADKPKREARLAEIAEWYKYTYAKDRWDIDWLMEELRKADAEIAPLRDLAEVAWQIRQSTAGAEYLDGTPAEKLEGTLLVIEENHANDMLREHSRLMAEIERLRGIVRELNHWIQCSAQMGKKCNCPKSRLEKV